MAPWDETDSSVSTKLLETSANVYGNAQKNLVKSTHPIGKTRSMQMMLLLSPAADGMTYVNAPTWDGRRFPQWYLSMMSGFETRVVPWTRSDSQISWMKQGKALRNYINSGATSLSVVSITLGVPLSVFFQQVNYKVQPMICLKGLRFAPNNRTASAVGERMLKPSCILRCVSPRINLTIFGVHANA